MRSKIQIICRLLPLRKFSWHNISIFLERCMLIKKNKAMKLSFIDIHEKMHTLLLNFLSVQSVLPLAYIKLSHAILFGIIFYCKSNYSSDYTSILDVNVIRHRFFTYFQLASNLLGIINLKLLIQQIKILNLQRNGMHLVYRY